VSDERLDLIDGLIYADAYGCALTLDELWRFARVPVARDELARRLRDDPALRQVVLEADGLFCLSDRPVLLAERPERTRRARRLQRRAARVAGVIRHLPFVRGVALTGSLAADDAPEGADTDLLIVVADGRLGTVFLLLATTSRLLGRELFCPNYYLCESHLRLPPGDVYIAHELAQARPLAGDAPLLRSLNPWLTDVFPNDRLPHAAPAPTGSPPQRGLERLLRGRPGRRLEAFAVRVAHSRLTVHHGLYAADVPEEVRASLDAGAALRFPGKRTAGRALHRYTERRAEVAERLRSAVGAL
jgi:hypothetical protein